VIHNDGSYSASIARPTFRTSRRASGEVLLPPGNLGYPFSTWASPNRRLHLLRPPFPRRRARTRVERAEIVFNRPPRSRAERISLEAGATGARRGQRLLHRSINRVAWKRLEYRRVLRIELFSAIRAAASSRRLRATGRSADGGPGFDLISEVRKTWQFFRDRVPKRMNPWLRPEP